MKISGNAYSFQFQIFRRVLNSMPKKIKQKVTRGHNIVAIHEHRLNKVVERIVRRINAHKRTKRLDLLSPKETQLVALKRLEDHVKKFTIKGKKGKKIIYGCHTNEFYNGIFCAIFRGLQPRFYIRPIILDAIVKKFDKLKKSITHAEESFGAQKLKIHISPEIRKSLINVFDPSHKKCVNSNNGEPIDITYIVKKYMDIDNPDTRVFGHANEDGSITITIQNTNIELNINSLATQIPFLNKFQCNGELKTTCPEAIIDDVFRILKKKSAINILARPDTNKLFPNGIFRYNDGKNNFFFFICGGSIYPVDRNFIFERFPKFKSFIERTLLLDKIPRLQ